MAARTHSYAEPTSNRGRSTVRATLALVCGLAAAIAIPVGIELTHKAKGAVLLDAAWAIPVAAVAAVAALMFERGARGAVSRSLQQAQGSRLLLAARVLAITGICLTVSSAIAVGIYEYLISLEQH